MDEDHYAEVPARRLRVAVLNRQFMPTGGGAERYSIALVEHLAHRHEMHVFAQDIAHNWPGVTYHRIGKPCARPRWVNQLWFALETWWKTRRGFDVVHSHENTWHGQVQTVHVVPIDQGLFDKRGGWRLALRWLQVITSPRLLAYRALEQARYAAPHRIVLASQALRATLLRWHPGTAGRLTVITPGVEAISSPASLQEQRVARAALGLPLDGRCVLFIGNDVRKKGLPVLITALATLPADVFLAVVCNPAQSGLVSMAMEAAGVAQRVHFLGSLRDVTPAYRAADCLAHPTLADTFAMVVLEAMANGLPVVVSTAAYCGISELLGDGQEALLLQDPEDAQLLARRLHEVLEDGALRETLCAHAQRFAQDYLWSAQAVRQELMYLSVA